MGRLTAKLALRNLARHRGRSAIMLVALILFVGVCVGMEGIASGFYGSMTEVAVGQTLGEVQIHAPGHLPTRDPAATVSDTKALLEQLATVDELRVAAERVRTQGYASGLSEARGVDVIGAGARELEFGDIPSRIVAGRFLITGDRSRVVIGQGLAGTLGLEFGDELLLQVGDAVPHRFEVVGIFASGNRLTDARQIYAPLDDVGDLLNLGPDVSTEIAIRVERGADAGDVAARVRELCPPQRCEVQVWSELQPALAASMTTDHNFLRASFAVLVLVAGIMVLNLQLMSVLERTRELGMMLAIGATPRRLFNMLVAEALTLGLIGVGGGLALGVAVVGALSGGIDMVALVGGETQIGGFAFAPRVYPDLQPDVAIGMCLGALLVTVLAAVIPALHLFRMNPLSALRDGEGDRS